MLSLALALLVGSYVFAAVYAIGMRIVRGLERLDQ